MRVLLLATNKEVEPYPTYPLGMSVLATALQAHGHEVRQVDMLSAAATQGASLPATLLGCTTPVTTYQTVQIYPSCSTGRTSTRYSNGGTTRHPLAGTGRAQRKRCTVCLRFLHL